MGNVSEETKESGTETMHDGVTAVAAVDSRAAQTKANAKGSAADHKKAQVAPTLTVHLRRTDLRSVPSGQLRECHAVVVSSAARRRS